MAVCLLIEPRGGTIEQYDEVMKQLDASGGPLGEGQTFHACGPTDDGFMVIDVWESRDDFDRHLQGRLGQALQEVNMPQPQVREISLHNQVVG